MLEGHGIWMTKGKRVDVSSTWEISVHNKKWKKERMDYHTTYRKVSAKKMIRTVNVKGESIVKGGKCTTEKMSPRPCTITTTCEHCLAVSMVVHEIQCSFGLGNGAQFEPR